MDGKEGSVIRISCLARILDYGCLISKVKYLRCEIYEQISEVLLSQYNKKTLSVVGKHLT